MRVLAETSPRFPDSMPGLHRDPHSCTWGPRAQTLEEMVTPKSDMAVGRRGPARGRLVTHHQVDKHSNFKARHVV